MPRQDYIPSVSASESDVSLWSTDQEHDDRIMGTSRVKKALEKEASTVNPTRELGDKGFPI